MVSACAGLQELMDFLDEDALEQVQAIFQAMNPPDELQEYHATLAELLTFAARMGEGAGLAAEAEWENRRAAHMSVAKQLPPALRAVIEQDCPPDYAEALEEWTPEDGQWFLEPGQADRLTQQGYLDSCADFMGSNIEFDEEPSWDVLESTLSNLVEEASLVAPPAELVEYHKLVVGWLVLTLEASLAARQEEQNPDDSTARGRLAGAYLGLKNLGLTLGPTLRLMDPALKQALAESGCLIEEEAAADYAEDELIEAPATPPYARLVPEPSAAIPAGETVTFIAETNLPGGMVVRAVRAYRPEGECESGRKRIVVDDGERVTIEACHDGIGVILVHGAGEVYQDYLLGAPAGGGREVEYKELSFWDYDSPAMPDREWYLSLGGIPVELEGVDWQSGQIMMPIRLVLLPDFPSLEGYFVDIFQVNGKRLVRLDFADARRVEGSSASARTIERLDLHESGLEYTFIFQWEPCAKPWGRIGDIGVSFVEKSSPDMPSTAPVC